MKAGKFRERYYVIKSKVGATNAGRYPIHSGIGWTNAVFIGLTEGFHEAKITK